MTTSDAAIDPNPLTESAAAFLRRLLFWLACAVALILPMLYPSQTPFVGDEPLLLRMALESNKAGKLADVGLMGTHGRRYGPGAVWAYQAILLITHDPVAIMSIRIALLQSATIAALIWLAQVAKLWKWALPALAMSPYLWFFERQLWDNSFNLPLSVLCLAAYASFLNRPRAWPLMIAIFTAAFMPLVHLTAVVVLPGILLHLLMFRRAELARFWPLVITAMLLPALIAIPYLSQIAKYDPAYDRPNAADARRFWFALLGPRVLSGAWLELLFPASWLASAAPWHRALLAALRSFSLIAFPLTWLGMLIGLRSLIRRIEMTADSLVGLCVLIVMMQAILDIATNTFGHAHYYSATWGMFAVLMWVGLDRVTRLAWGWLIALVQTVSVAGICLLLLLRVMQTGGTRDWSFGATLSNQIQILREWSRYDERSPIHIDSQVRLFPISLQTLEALQPLSRKGGEPVAELVVRYTSDDPNDARLVLVEEK